MNVSFISDNIIMTITIPLYRHVPGGVVMEDFVRTHRSTCARVGVRLAPETDKEKAFSCETSGTVLGVQYDTVTWSWNIDCEKLKVILHMLYDMVESESVTNGEAMSISGKVVHYAPFIC